jgi:hypothetical protein
MLKLNKVKLAFVHLTLLVLLLSAVMAATYRV